MRRIYMVFVSLLTTFFLSPAVYAQMGYGYGMYGGIQHCPYGPRTAQNAVSNRDEFRDRQAALDRMEQQLKKDERELDKAKEQARESSRAVKKVLTEDAWQGLVDHWNQMGNPEDYLTECDCNEPINPGSTPSSGVVNDFGSEPAPNQGGGVAAGATSSADTVAEAPTDDAPSELAASPAASGSVGAAGGPAPSSVVPRAPSAQDESLYPEEVTPDGRGRICRGRAWLGGRCADGWDYLPGKWECKRIVDGKCEYERTSSTTTFGFWETVTNFFAVEGQSMVRGIPAIRPQTSSQPVVKQSASGRPVANRTEARLNRVPAGGVKEAVPPAEIPTCPPGGVYDPGLGRCLISEPAPVTPPPPIYAEPPPVYAAPPRCDPDLRPIPKGYCDDNNNHWNRGSNYADYDGRVSYDVCYSVVKSVVKGKYLRDQYHPDRDDCEDGLDEWYEAQEVIRELGDDLRERQRALRQARRQFDRDYEREVEDLEAQCPDGSCYDVHYSQKPSTAQTVGNIFTTLLGAGIAYKLGDNAIDMNARAGWPTPPMAVASLGYPFMMAGLYGLTAGMQGQGGFGCAGGAFGGGYPGGPYGMPGMGGPFGGMYPGMGGPFGYPPGMYGPPMGGGMYMPGMGPWGMAGPWGTGGGMFPGMGFPGMAIGGGFAIGGMPMGGGFAMGGMPMGGFPMGGGMYGGMPMGGGFPMGGMAIGGGFAVGGMPMGGFPMGGGMYGGMPMGGFPMGGGMYGGMPMGGIAIGGGLAIGGMPMGGGMYGGFPMGGGMYGGMPMGGFAGGGMMGGYPLAGGMAMGGMAVGGMQMQMQMMQMYQQQMQQYMAIQQQQMQEQMYKQQAIGSLTQELYRIQMQIQQISMGGYGSSIFPGGSAPLAPGPGFTPAPGPGPGAPSGGGRSAPRR